MINRSLLWRLQRLEAKLRLDEGAHLRIGRLRKLPADYTGERHVAIVWSVRWSAAATGAALRSGRGRRRRDLAIRCHGSASLRLRWI